MAQTLYLIDGHAQIYRAYFAIRGGLNSPITGEPTNAVFAFSTMLLKLFDKFHPHYVAMPVDAPGKTFRDDLYKDYKATRDKTPDDFRAQIPRIFEVTRLFGIPVLAVPGAEADDIIATIVERILGDPACAQVDIRIVSRDKDLEQLLGPRVTLFDIHTDTTIDTAHLLRDKGITPQQVGDVLALAGDTVDNIPGVPGVGLKTAIGLVQQFGTIDNLLANLDQVKGKRREAIEGARADLMLSRQLVALKRDLDMPFSLESARIGAIDVTGLRRVFTELGFRRQITDLDRLLGQRTPAAPEVTGQAAGAQPASAAPASDDEFATSLFDAGPLPTVTDEAATAAGAGEPLATAADCEYRGIFTLDELRELVDTLMKQPIISVDTETTGLGRGSSLCGICLAWQDRCGVYVPMRSPTPERHLSPQVVLDTLRPVLEDPGVPKCGHNLKYDAMALRREGVTLRGIAFDSMIAAFLTDAPGLSLDALASAQIKHRMIPISQLIGADKKRQRTMDCVPLEQVIPYAAEDADIALRLCHGLGQQLRVLGLDQLAHDVEMPLVEVLAEMEHQGIRVEPGILSDQKRELEKRILELRGAIFEKVGVEFNIESPKQLADVLFKQLKLPVIKKTKTGVSTDIEVLERLCELEGLTDAQCEVPRLLVEYRQLTKLTSTYLEALRESIDGKTGRVHASFHQTGAATGRLSSSGPNLQNIPVRSEVGRQIRKAFVAEPGQQLLSADYSQIELRILAHLSGDPALIEAFENNRDIHAAVAAQVFNTPLEEVTKEQRNSAKVINFGIVYGVTPSGLARRIEGLNLEGAKALIADYRKRFAGIDRFLQQCIRQAMDSGFVTTMLGRRRSIPQISSHNHSTRALGERLAINTVVQGSAADLIKLAMVNLHRRIVREKLPAKILLQIHDELVLEAPAGDAPAIAQVVRHEMEHAQTLRVPLKVEVGIGKDWFEAK